MASFSKNKLPQKLTVFLSFLLSLWILVLLLYIATPATLQASSSPSTCHPDIGPFYVYDLPPHFNRALLHRCRSLSAYTDMCPHVANQGLGRPLGPPASTSWYATHQFLAEMLFHARALRHPCRTLDSALAELFYVPFYAGLYASSQFPNPNFTLRDELSYSLADHLIQQPNWHHRRGHDHFLVIGRTAWDFMRDDHAADFGANRLLLIPELANMTVLTVERHPWSGRNQRGIPYPSYFHPRTGSELTAWQDLVRKSNRTHLFTFIGGPRPAQVEKSAVRVEILKQCGASNQCVLVECEPGSSGCYEPSRILKVMTKAEFCLQPPGDSFTRRSVFDSILSGCVPVFFSEHTAYTQYEWLMPSRVEEWSVFIKPDRWGRIEEELDRVPRDELERMRCRVVDMLPGLTYAHPNANPNGLRFMDAVDVTLVQLSRSVRSSLSRRGKSGEGS